MDGAERRGMRVVDASMRSLAMMAMGLAASCAPSNDAGNVAMGNAAATEEVAPGAAAPPAPPPLEGQRPVNVEAAAPESAPARYVGRWAAKEALCKQGAWKFDERHLATAGEVSCDFSRVTQVAGGYDIEATCHAEGDTTEDRISLRFAESAGAMLVESKIFRPVGLIRCPE